MCACNAPILSLSPSPSSPSPSRKRGRPRRDCRCGLWNPSFSFVSNVEHVLSSLMCLVTDRKPYSLGSDFHASFSLSPTLHYYFSGSPSPTIKSMCLCIDNARVAASSRSECYHFCKEGYLNVILCGHKVRAHRFVLWALRGFYPVKLAPPQGGSVSDFLLEPLCLHICGNKGCLNPCHLVWGDCSSNRARDRCRFVYSALLELQGRLSDSLLMSWDCDCARCVS